MKGKGMRNQGNSSWSNVEKYQVIILTYGTRIWWNLSAPSLSKEPKKMKPRINFTFLISDIQEYLSAKSNTQLIMKTSDNYHYLALCMIV